MVCRRTVQKGDGSSVVVIMLSKCVAAAAHSVHNPFRRVGVSAAKLFMDLTRPYKVAKALSTTLLYCGVSRGVNSNPMCVRMYREESIRK